MASSAQLKVPCEQHIAHISRGVLVGGWLAATVHSPCQAGTCCRTCTTRGSGGWVKSKRKEGWAVCGGVLRGAEAGCSGCSEAPDDLCAKQAFDLRADSLHTTLPLTGRSACGSSSCCSRRRSSRGLQGGQGGVQAVSKACNCAAANRCTRARTAQACLAVGSKRAGGRVVYWWAHTVAIRQARWCVALTVGRAASSLGLRIGALGVGALFSVVALLLFLGALGALAGGGGGGIFNLLTPAILAFLAFFASAVALSCTAEGGQSSRAA